MNVLLLGSGGREHALAWKLSQSDLLTELFIAPGNAGTMDFGSNLQFDINDFSLVKNAVLQNDIDLVIVGPEAPLVSGIHDFFHKDDFLTNIPMIGPYAEGAQLEGSKDFAKEFMKKYNIPTAAYKTFDKDSATEGKRFLETMKPPYVLKADGLAAGKGVLIIDNLEEAQNQLDEMLAGQFGIASSKVVIEEFLSGIELSVFILTDGQSYITLPEAKDYKRIGEGDTGLNTGGMGAVSPVPFADDEFMGKIDERIIKPTVKGLQVEGIDYQGFIFFGLINVNGEPYVIEYNVRLGDPEAEVVLPRIKSDLLELFEAISHKKLGEKTISFDSRSTSTLMLVSGGYPGNYEKGKVITGLEKARNNIVFHAGTKANGGKILTNGGRVLAISSYGNNKEEALASSLECAETIEFKGKYYRKDIGFDL